MTDIAIIGGGAAAAAVFAELLRQPYRQGVVHWIAGTGTPGRGVAYATADPRHLLNVRAAGMSLLADRPDDFLRYAQQALPSASGADFLPRALFGDFIQDQLRQGMRQAAVDGVRYRIHAPRAVRVQREGDGFRVVLGDGTQVTAGAAVLALGALSPRPLKAVSEGALQSGAYHLDPWSVPEPRVPPRRVVVVGTGLTAIDTLITLAARWPQASLVAVSRHGLLPFRHADGPLAPYPHLPELHATLLASDGVARMLRRVREAMAAEPGTDWRAVIDGLRPINAALWQALTVRQRRQFLRHVRWVWEAARHRSAPRSHDAVAELMAGGRLQVKAARVVAVEPGQDGLALALRPRGATATTTMAADCVIQATGLDTAVAYASDPLLAQLLRDRLVVPDPLRLGIAATAEGAVLDEQGRRQAGLHAIGTLLRGSLWECTAMPEIRGAARTLAIRLAKRADAVQQGVPAR